MRCILGSTVLIFLLAAGVSGAVTAERHPCWRAAEERLRDAGLRFDDLQRADWIRETQYDGSRVTGYRLYAKPKQNCPSGNLVISMTRYCLIQNVYTSGECRVAGVEAAGWDLF